MNLDGLSCHRLQKLKKRFHEEEQMWCNLAATSRAHFQMIRVPTNRTLTWLHSLEPKWLPGLDRWIASVHLIYRSVKDRLDEEIHERTLLLTSEQIVFGLCRLEGFEQAQKCLLKRHYLINDTDSESSKEISESDSTISSTDESD